MIRKFLQALEKHVKSDKDRTCLESITLGFDIMGSLAKGDLDDVSNKRE
jgi:hypothetical protein